MMNFYKLFKRSHKKSESDETDYLPSPQCIVSQQKPSSTGRSILEANSKLAMATRYVNANKNRKS